MKSPYFTADHEVFRSTVRQFIAREVLPQIEQWERDEQIPRSMWKRLGELGFLGINCSEELGGTGADFFYSAAFIEELPRSNSGGFAASVSVHQFMAMEYLRKYGGKDLKFRLLRAAIAGEKIGALAITEPDAGSDVAAIKTRAVRDGDQYIINGSKTFITNGHYGDFTIVAAKTGPDAGASGISLFLVERGARGFSSRKLKKIGWHCSDTAELTFENVRVPESSLLGEENKGFYYIMDCFQLERLVSALVSVGGTDHCLNMTLKYASEREAFSKPLSRFQVIRHTLADIKARLEAARQLTYNCAWMYANGEQAMQYCAMAKLLASELAKDAADACIQVFGGYGYMDEYPVSRAFRDARAGTIVGGTSEIMREIISRFLIDGTTYQGCEPVSRPVDKAPEKSPAVPRVEKAPEIQPKKEETIKEAQMSTPTTGAEIVQSLCTRFRPEKAGDYSAVFHFDLTGEGGGQFTVTIDKGSCRVLPGLAGQPKCVFQAAAATYADIEYGRTNAEMAFMTGKIKVSNVGEMLRFVKLFDKVQG